MSLIEATPADWATVPAHLHEGIRRWVDEGIRPGLFLQGVIRNDLTGAATLADPENAKALTAIALFFFQHVPCACRGPRALESWPSILADMREAS